MTHELKTWPAPFRAIHEGRKRFEWRIDDRNFQEGDYLRLLEWNPASLEYSGKWILVEVLYLARGPDWEIPAGCVIMSIGQPHVGAS